MEFQLSEHANSMMKEREINKFWINATLLNYDIIENNDDGTIHYIKSIKEEDGRFLRVIVNPDFSPVLVVTMFFDRRLRSNNEIKS